MPGKPGGCPSEKGRLMPRVESAVKNNVAPASRQSSLLFDMAAATLAAAHAHWHEAPGEPLAHNEADAELVAGVRRCRIELGDCAAIPTNVRETLAEYTSAFEAHPIGALRLAGLLRGAGDFLRGLGSGQ